MIFNLKKYFSPNKSMRPLIIAEVSANHCGKKSLFLKSIKSAAKNGADLVKIQTYEAKDITINKSMNIKNWDKKKNMEALFKSTNTLCVAQRCFCFSKKTEDRTF